MLMSFLRESIYLTSIFLFNIMRLPYSIGRIVDSCLKKPDFRLRVHESSGDNQPAAHPRLGFSRALDPCHAGTDMV